MIIFRSFKNNYIRLIIFAHELHVPTFFEQ